MTIRPQKGIFPGFRLLLILGVPVICLSLLMLSIGGSAEQTQITQSSFSASLEKITSNRMPYSLVPEYSHNLELVVLSVTHRESDLQYQDRLINCFPDYTDIILMVPQIREEEINKILETKPYRERVRICSFDSQLQSGGEYYLLFSDEERLIQLELSDDERESHYGSLWTQDLFEVGLDRGGSPVLLIPELHKFYHNVSASGELADQTIQVKSDNQYLQDLKQFGVMTANLPIAFMGGNVISDCLNDRHIVFIGSDVLRGTKLIWQALDEFSPGESYITEFLKHVFAADEIVVIGNPDQQQPNRLFHLDQAMMILKPGVACVENVIPGANPNLLTHPDVISVRQYLSRVRETLTKRGYQVVDIEITPESVLGYRHNANVIPYIDKNSGDSVILMPVYTDSVDPDENDLVARNIRRLERLGFKVIPVPTQVNRIYGGIHCLANVVS